ncbi:2986_t:CDS:2, partial [Funneliformis geosporum]
MGKKPNIMGLLKQDEKVIELLYTELSRILWRETLDRASYISALCRPVGNQFGVVGIQVTGTTMYLNILVNDMA